MSHSKLLLLFTLLAGIGLGAWARDAIQSEPVTPGFQSGESTSPFNSMDGQSLSLDSDALATIEMLRDELQRAELERSELRDQLEEINARLGALDNLSSAAEAEKSAAAAPRPDTPRRRGSAGLTLESLQAAGISERDAGTIKSRLDALSMQRLYLRDQAQREGWLGKQEYRDQIRQLNEAQNNLEQEFGSDNYSRYLYAMGRPNQVSVQSVIENSPAFNAGMQSGDQLLSYDGQSVYDPRTIRRGTQQGNAGEMVPVIVNRNGQQVELYVPRGPLGIQMDSNSVRPPDDQR